MSKGVKRQLKRDLQRSAPLDWSMANSNCSYAKIPFQTQLKVTIHLEPTNFIPRSESIQYK